MYLNQKHICILSLLLLLVSSYYVIPLRTGTIQITDADFREAEIFRRLIDLNLTKQAYQSHKDTNVVAAITSLSMDENLNFYFNYDIICPEEACLLNFTLVRYTKEVNTAFNYHVVVDYLVARGLKVRDLNMTSFQEHMFMSQVVSYNENNEKEDLSEHLPFNNEDAMFMLLFPNGFNNVSLTGHVVYSYILGTDMYVVHYMDHTGQHGEHDSMGWPEKKNYIKYRAVFIPEDYLSYAGCIPQEQFFLNQHFEYSCSGAGKVKWFAGFKSTKENHIQGELFEQRSGFSYSLAQTPSRYGLMAFPFEVAEDFIDQRVHEYKWQVEYRMLGLVAGYIIAGSLIFGLAFLATLLVQRYIKRLKHPFKKVGKYDHMHEEVAIQTASST